MTATHVSTGGSRLWASMAMRIGLAVLVSGCVHATPLPHTDHAMPAPAWTPSYPPAQDAELVAEIDYSQNTRMVDVRYRVRNASTTSALAVFDRADMFTVKLNQQALGDVAVPHQTADGDDVTLWHVVPPEDPMTESVPTPTAMRLAPGATLSGQFTFGLLGTVMPKRMRWCVAVTRFDEGLFGSPVALDAGELWLASSAVIERQRLLCTPWYDVARAGFVD